MHIGGEQIRTHKHFDATWAKHPRPADIKQRDGRLWWNPLKPAAGVLYPFAIFCTRRFCASPRGGFKSKSDLGEESRVKGGNEEEKHTTCKIDARWWETREELRDEGMNKTKSAGDWRLPSRILKLHLLQRTLFVCVRVCTSTNPLHASESLCVCFVCVRAVRAHKSNTISLQTALAAARDTQFQWTDEKWIKEQQKKGRINNEGELWLQICG